MRVKPIETVYNGYRFRSRLEARWAVVFDALKLKWIYEPEGFELPDKSRYLPDFLVETGHPRWIEIKPADPTLQEFKKLALLVQGTKQTGIILAGAVGQHEFDSLIIEPSGDTVKARRETNSWLLHDWLASGIGVPVEDVEKDDPTINRKMWDRVEWAFDRARSTRFEMGDPARD
jgi:hypothetical protein